MGPAAPASRFSSESFNPYFMKPRTFAFVTALVSATTAAPAAEIIWTVHNITNDVTNVSTAGTLVDARTGRTGLTNNVTVNGVTFKSVENSGNLFDSLFANDSITSRGYGNVVTDANYRTMLGYGQRSGRLDNTPPRIAKTADWTTVNFTGLTLGNTYQIQIWYSDNAGTTQNTVLVLGDGVTAGSPVFGTDAQLFQEVAGGGAGQYATGRFVADATTQSFNVRTRTNLTTTSTWNNQDHFSNGWQIRDLGLDNSPPTPDPMTWASVPAAVTESTITMTATTASDQTGVEYRFTRYAADGTTVLFNSAWQDNPVFTDAGLSEATTYGYTVTARDKTPSQHATAASAPVAFATTPSLDNSPPSPSPMTWASVPAATGYSAITMTATTATDPSGVEYYFDETSGNPGGTDSGWQDSPTYTDTGLDPNTAYSYTVTARDKSGAQNTTAPSSPAAPATTDLKGTAVITWNAYDITNDVANVSTTGSLVSARNGATSSRTVNGVTFESVANSGNLFDSLFANDSIGNRGYGNVVTNADYQNFLSLGQRSGRLGFGGLPQIEPTQLWTTVEFTGLTTGNTYQVQIWASDGATDGVVQTKALVLGNGSAAGPDATDTFLYYEMTDGGAGQYGIGTFVANAPNQAFNVRIRQNLNTTPAWANNDHFSNGWQLRDLGVVGPDITAPNPNPMTWASVPVATGDSSITMTATTATDDNDVEYFFEETSNNPGGTDSGWQDSPVYTDTVLSPGTEYTYTVTARDKSANQNPTGASTPASATTASPDLAPPTPNPMTFATAPAATGPYSIAMTAATATDVSGVEYFFDETSGNPGGTDSGWQDSPVYNDGGLSPNTLYTYTVTARDKSTAQNTTDPSAAASATTDDIDNIAPTPDPMTFATAPASVSSTAITMTAATATDVSGVQYYFDETSGNPGGTDSGWQDSPVYTDTGLNPNTQYSYTVTARDKGPLLNPTAASSAAHATTHPTAVITWNAHNITNNVGDVSASGTLHDARNGATSSQFVNGTVFESVANSGNLFDSLFANDTISNRGYGSVVTKLSYQTFLRFGQRSGRPNDNTPPRIASTQNWATVTFTGLTVGNIYEIQIWASDVGLSADGVAQRKALVLGNGAPGAPAFGMDTRILYEVTDYGAGQYGTGTFVAVAPTQSFNVQTWDNLDTTPVARTQDHFSNGWQIRDLGPSVSDYDRWVMDQGLTPGAPDTGENQDFDRDGLTNLQERIFGLDSTDPSSLSPYTMPFDPSNGTFSYKRRSRSLTGLDYKVWYSTDLTDWFVDNEAVQNPGSPVNDVETVGVQITRSLLQESKLFIRLGADTPVPPDPAPRLASVWGSGSAITLNFTEAMDPTRASNAANYAVQLDGGAAVIVTGASLGQDGKTVTLTLGSSLGIGSAYNVTTSNLTGGQGLPLSGAATTQFVTWDNDPNGIKVFILIGQSNMVGYGYSEVGGNPLWTDTPENTEPKELTGGPGSLRYLANNDALYPEYDYTTLLVNPADPATSAWKTRPDVKVWWEQGVSGNLNGAEGFGNLGPPFRGGSTDWFGPEYGFGQIIGDYYGGANEAPVLIIKAAWGGHSLGGNFRPPSAVADRAGVVGASYHEIFANTRFILNNLADRFKPADHPEFAAVGYRYQIAGIALHQGYTDRVSANISPEYRENLPDFIHDVRGAFGKPALPFVIASTGMDTTFVEASPYPNYSEVEQAQLWVVGDTPPPNVRSSDTRSFMESAVNSPRNQAFHWHGNARSYFRVGLSLGNDMKTLLDAP
jgi:hypothetical protein